MVMKRIRLFEIFGLVALLSLTGIACVSNAVDANGDRLEGVTWVLKSYGDPDDLTAAVTDRDVTLTFDKEEGRLGGNAGVNSYGGNYEVNGNRLTVSDLVSTKIAGPPPLQNQENTFFNILKSAESFDIDDGELTITGTAGVLVLEKK